MNRAWPTGLPLVDKLRSCMLQSVPHGQTSGRCSSLPYDAAELIHDLHDALEDIDRRILCPVGPSPSLETIQQIASAAIARARGEQ